MEETFCCPDCGREIRVLSGVPINEKGRKFSVCIDCYEEIYFERTKLWKECLKNAKCLNATTSAK